MAVTLRRLARRVIHSRLMPAPVRDGVMGLVSRARMQRQARPSPVQEFRGPPGDCRVCGGALSEVASPAGNQIYRTVWDHRRAVLFGCGACGHRQFLPDLTDRDLGAVYAASYFTSDDERALYERLYRLGHNDTAAHFRDTFVRWGHAPGARVHEFGCGTGLSVHHLRRLGYEATGSDWSQVAIGFGRAQGNAHLVIENANTLHAMAPASLDIVMTNHVIEHLPDPVGFLSSLGRLLRPGGIVVMRFPNGDNVITRRLGMIHDPLFYFPHHIHYFGPRSIALAGQRAGLGVLAVRATTRMTPALLDAAAPAEGNIHARIEAAAAAFGTEELEVVFAPPGSEHVPEAGVASALGHSPPPSPALSSGRVASRWNSSADFHTPASRWRYLCARREGDPLNRAEAMAWDGRHGLYNFGAAAIGDHWLQADPSAGVPMLVFTPEGAGRHTVHVEMSARFMGGPPIQLQARVGERIVWSRVLDGPAPQHWRETLDLSASAPLVMMAMCVPGHGQQRAVCIVAVDPA